MADQADPIQQKIDEAAHVADGTSPANPPSVHTSPPEAPSLPDTNPIAAMQTPSEPPPSPVKSKRGVEKVAAVLTVFILLTSLPVAIYFVSQKQKPIADIRNRAAVTIVYAPISPVGGITVDSLSPTFTWTGSMPANNNYQNICIGTWVSSSSCESIGCFSVVGRNSYTHPAPLTPNTNYGWTVYSAYAPGTHNISNMAGECQSFRTPNVQPTPTPTATPTPAAQCQRIKVYKGGTVISDLTTLRTGDQVELAVVGTNATKARIRVNGGSWNETSTKNSAGEYTVAFTIPVATFNFTIEAEVFQSGLWQ